MPVLVLTPQVKLIAQTHRQGTLLQNAFVRQQVLLMVIC